MSTQYTDVQTQVLWLLFLFIWGGGGYVVKRKEYLYKEDLFFIIEIKKNKHLNRMTT